MLIKVRVTPESKKEEIIEKSEDSYTVKVKEKAEEGKTNRRVKEMLAAYFNVHLGKIRLLKSGRKQNKIFEVIK